MGSIWPEPRPERDADRVKRDGDHSNRRGTELRRKIGKERACKKPAAGPSRVRLLVGSGKRSAQKKRTGFEAMRSCSSGEQPAFVATSTLAPVAFTRLLARR